MTETTSTPVSRADGGAVRGGFAAALERWWAQLDERRRMRITIAALSELDERTLEDIGVEHGDFEGAVHRRSGRKGHP